MEDQVPYGDNFPTNDLAIDASGLAYLSRIAQWSKFLAIILFIVVGIVVFLGLYFILFFSGPSMDAIEDMGIPLTLGSAMFRSVGVMYLLVSLVYFFPALYLYRFSSRTETALVNHDSLIFTNALESLHAHYKFIGIVVIAIIAFQGLVLLFGLFSFASLS